MKVGDVIGWAVVGTLLVAAFFGIRSCCRSEELQVKAEQARIEALPMFITVDGVKYQSVQKSVTISHNGMNYFKLADQ